MGRKNCKVKYSTNICHVDALSKLQDYFYDKYKAEFNVSLQISVGTKVISC